MMCTTQQIERTSLEPLTLLGLERLPFDLQGDESLAGLAIDLEEAALPWERLGPHLRFDQAGYCRTILHRSPSWELVLVGWLPGQRSPIHDHGRSSGVVRLVLGELVETLLQPRGSKMERIRVRRFHPGEVMVERPGIIHQVHSDSDHPAASLHLYSPPLVRMGQHLESPSPHTAQSP